MSRRANGEGSIYPYRNGWAAHVWITTPAGRRQRKSVYGKTRQEVHTKWLRLHEQARRGPVAPVSPRLRDFLRRWLRETVKPNLSPATAEDLNIAAWSGVAIAKIKRGSIADRAGFEPGDIIVKLGDAPVRNTRELAAALENTRAPWSVSIDRGGTVRTFRLD